MAAQSPSQQERLPAHLALRIALAARALKGIDTASLVRVLIAAVGEPITEARLAKLRASRLRSRLSEQALTEELTDRQIHRALGLLKGRGVSMPEDPLPAPQAYQAGDMPDSIRVACASNTGDALDGIFGSCSRFLIYQISPQENRLIELRDAQCAADHSDRHAYRAELLKDCHLLYTLSIGGPAAAKVVRMGVHPVRVARAVPAKEIVEELQRVLATAPPPWLAKVMGAEPGQRVRFSCENS